MFLFTFLCAAAHLADGATSSDAINSLALSTADVEQCSAINAQILILLFLWDQAIRLKALVVRLPDGDVPIAFALLMFLSFGLWCH